jgi:hypothetical protein
MCNGITVASVVRLVLLSLVVVATCAKADDRLSVPDSQAFEKASREVREAFKSDSVSKDPARQLELAHKLVDAANAGKDPPAVRYAELCGARDLASAVDLQVAFDITDQLIKAFVIDPGQARIDILSSGSAHPTVPAVESVISWSGEALATGKFDQARRLDDAASTLAGRMNDPLVSADAREQSRQVLATEKEARVIEGLRSRLNLRPDDAETSVELGRQLCITGKWDQAMALLQKSPDVRLRAAAELELRKPSTPTVMLAAGDAWSALADSNRSFPAALARRRAATWYRQVAPQLEGLAKIRVEGRLAEADRRDDAPVPGLPGTWITLAWTGVKWDPVPAPIGIERAASTLRLNNAGSARVYYVNSRVIPGDFAVGLTIKGPCMIGLLSADRKDHSVYCAMPDDGKWHELRLERQGGQAWTATQDSREKQVQDYGATPRMPGVIGFLVDAGHRVEVRSFVLR